MPTSTQIPNAAAAPDFKPSMWSGDLNIALYSGDTLLGERDVGEATVFQMEEPSVEKAELKGKRRSSYGKTITSVNKSVTQEFTCSIANTGNTENLVLALLGESAAYTQSAGNDAAPVDFVITSLGLWYPLGHRMISTTTKPVVTDDAGTPVTLTENTDYVIDYQVGRIMALAGGAIAAGDTIKVTTTWTAITSGVSISALANLNIYAQVRLIGQNEITGEAGELIIYKGQIEPSGALPWLTDDYQSIDLKITANDVPAGLWNFIKY